MYVSEHGTTAWHQDCAYHSSRCTDRAWLKKERMKKKVVRLSRVTNWNLENVKFSGTKIKVISSLKLTFLASATAR